MRLSVGEFHCSPCSSSVKKSREKGIFVIEAFFLRLQLHHSSSASSLPKNPVLVFPPRSDERTLEINGSRIRSGSPAIVPLQRLRSAAIGGSEGVFVSTDRIRMGGGALFEVYAWEERVVAGVVRDAGGAEWEMGCRWDSEVDPDMFAVSGVELCVVDEMGRQMKGKVEKVPRGSSGKRRRRRERGYVSELPGIPEEEEEEDEEEEREWDDEGYGEEGEGEVEEDGVKWAVDVGLWVVCVGVGLLLSRASLSSMMLRKRQITQF